LIKVAICGVAGKMGQEVLKTIVNAEDTELCAAVDLQYEGQDAGVLLGKDEPLGVFITNNLNEALATSGADVLVDFTRPQAVAENVKKALQAGVRPVVGTTGMSKEQLLEVTLVTRPLYTSPAFTSAVKLSIMARACLPASGLTAPI